nr:reverse transcriptase domain, reverse transcriptase zinc-binding domain protein [Tanacetum cinerariifolium]
MFGFCRFNGVDNSQDLIDSLNGVWIGKLRLHANIARFDKNEGFRPPQANVKKFVTTASTSIKRGDNRSHSFVNVVKGVSNGEKIGTGDFRSIANSRIICRNEGFSGVDIKYLGGLWALFVFKHKHVRDKFINHKGIKSWFTSLEPWYNDFVLNERLIWLEIKGVPIIAWHNDTFKSICRKWGEALFIDDSDSSNRFSIRLCIKSSHNSLIFASTTVKLNGVTYAYRVRELCSWTLNFALEVVDIEEEGYVADDGNVEEEGSVENYSNADGGKVEAEEKELMGELFCNDDNETPPNMKENLDAQPSNSDPFELEHLIAKNGNYKSNKQGSSTPIDVIMEKLGFGFKWRMWIPGCLKNFKAFILINGSPTPEFDMFNGLRQGDPMSPLLFILAMEGLNALVSKAVSTGLFKGASIGRGNINVSHLLYADDAIFVGEWSHSNAYNLLCLLRCFYTVSGLEINVHNSKILGVNILDEEVSSMALVLGCGVAKLPMMYLGVPIGSNMGRCDNWNRVVQKFESNMNDELIQVTRDVALSDSTDAWTWELDKSGYSVSSARIHIEEHTLNSTFTSTRWL